MSRYWDDSDEIERRIYRGCMVAEYGPDGATALDYIRWAKRQ